MQIVQLEAYKLFLKQTGAKPIPVVIDRFLGSLTFDDHVEEVENSSVVYKEKSGWTTFLNVCGFLNLILFVIGGIWLLKARSSEQFEAMNLTIFGLVAAINCFFFSFLVNIFTRIQHNTHQTTILLSKLIDKTESKD